MSLERILYESRATGSTDSLLNLATILAQSQRNNARDGFTGALAAHRDRYVQVLEGTRVGLDSLMRRLSGDARHADIRVLDRQPIAARSFGEWTMASTRITPDLVALLDQVNAGGRADQIVEALREAAEAA